MNLPNYITARRKNQSFLTVIPDGKSSVGYPHSDGFESLRIMQKEDTPFGVSSFWSELQDSIILLCSRRNCGWQMPTGHLHLDGFESLRIMQKEDTPFGVSSFWSGLRDSNPRSLGPKPSAIPNFAKPRSVTGRYYTPSSRKMQPESCRLYGIGRCRRIKYLCFFPLSVIMVSEVIL